MPDFPEIFRLLIARKRFDEESNDNSPALQTLLEAYAPLKVAQLAKVDGGFLIKAICAFDTVRFALHEEARNITLNLFVC